MIETECFFQLLVSLPNANVLQKPITLFTKPRASFSVTAQLSILALSTLAALRDWKVGLFLLNLSERGLRELQEFLCHVRL